MKIYPLFTAITAASATARGDNTVSSKSPPDSCVAESMTEDEIWCFNQIQETSKSYNITYSEDTIKFITEGYFDFRTPVDGNIICSNTIHAIPNPESRLTIVDTHSDDILKQYIDHFKVSCQGKNGQQKFLLLRDYVKEFFKTSRGLELSDTPKLLGELPGHFGSVCIQYSLLTKALADSVPGLEANLRIGAYKKADGNYELHAWNEVIVEYGNNLYKFFLDVFVDDSSVLISEKKNDPKLLTWEPNSEAQNIFRGLPTLGVMRKNDRVKLNKLLVKFKKVCNHYYDLNKLYAQAVKKEISYERADQIFYKLKEIEGLYLKMLSKVFELSSGNKLYIEGNFNTINE